MNGKRLPVRAAKGSQTACENANEGPATTSDGAIMADKKKTAEKRITLSDAAAAAAKSAGDKAVFQGWSKVQCVPVMMGRFSDGTVVYRDKSRSWVFGKSA
jgi:hypothetical protein